MDYAAIIGTLFGIARKVWPEVQKAFEDGEISTEEWKLIANSVFPIFFSKNNNGNGSVVSGKDPQVSLVINISDEAFGKFVSVLEQLSKPERINPR